MTETPESPSTSSKHHKHFPHISVPSARSRVGSRAKTFILGHGHDHEDQKKPRPVPSTTSAGPGATYSKEDESVKLEVDKPVDGIVDEYSTLSREKLLLAAMFVNDAKLGRNYDVIENRKSLKLYNLFNNRWLRAVFYIALILNLSLVLFEHPATELLLPYWATLPMEIATLFLFLFRFIHMYSFTERQKFWCDTKNIIVLVTIALTFLDILIFTGMMIPLKMGIRWSRALRPLFIINFSEARQIRRAFRNIRKTLPDVSNVLFLFFINIIIFTLVSLKLFGKSKLTYPDGTAYFNNFVDSFFDLYVLVTTANNPDVMMPAFDSTRWYVIFFTSFLLICLFIFMSVVLAVIFHNYKRHLKIEVKISVLNKREKLNRAFDLLKVEINGKMVLTRARFKELMKHVPPERSQILISILWFVLDEKMNNFIEKQAFLKLSDLLNVEVSEIKGRKILIERMCPRCYNSIPSSFIRKCVQHKFFRYTFNILIMLNAIFIILAIELADWIFLGLFVLELLLKMYTVGFKHFFNEFWNIFDFFVVGVAAVMTLIAQLSAESEDTATLDALLVLRVLRLVKIIGRVERFRVIVETLMHILPFIIVYGGVMFVFYYFFAIIGMELFNGKISYYGYGNSTPLVKLSCGSPELIGSEFARLRYCNNNFNNILNSMVVLFELTVVNQWHIITAGYVAVTSKWARFYFLSFHLCCVIIVLNIFTALVLEAFLLEYTFSKGAMENAMEIKIEQLGLGIDKHRPELWVSYTDGDELVTNEHAPPHHADDHDHDHDTLPDLSRDTDIRFHLSKNVKDVEVLLQRMFENELEENDDPSVDLSKDIIQYR